MNIVPWRNRGELMPFREDFEDWMNRFFDRGLENRLPATFQRVTSPPVNVAETEKAWIVTLDLPGLDEKDIQVQLMGRQLVVSGERKWEAEQKDKEFHRRESQYGAFQRVIELPENTRAEADALVASYKRGILEIMVPKVEPTPAKKIPVKKG